MHEWGCGHRVRIWRGTEQEAGDSWEGSGVRGAGI